MPPLIQGVRFFAFASLRGGGLRTLQIHHRGHQGGDPACRNPGGTSRRS